LALVEEGGGLKMTTIGAGRVAALYIRESQYNEHDRTPSEAQLAVCRDLALALGYTVTDEATLLDSGPNSTLMRPGITKLIGLVAAGQAAAVVVYTLNRLGRTDSQGLEALLRELRRRGIPVYIAHTPKGYRYDSATGKLLHDPEAIHAANREEWREPDFIVIPRENEQDDLVADRLTLGSVRRGVGDSSAN